MSYISADKIKEIISSDSDMKAKIDSLPYNLQLPDLIEMCIRDRSCYSYVIRPVSFQKPQRVIKVVKRRSA